MCGILATVVKKPNNRFWDLLRASEIRGQDGTGYVYYSKKGQMYNTYKVPFKASDIPIRSAEVLHPGDMVIAQNRLACFGLNIDNQQPIISQDILLVHNGNLFDFESVFKQENLERRYQVDSELILRLYEKYRNIDSIYQKTKGNFACILVDRNRRKIFAFTNDKPLCRYEDETGIYFFSTLRIGQKVFGKDAKIEELQHLSKIEFNF